MATRRGYQPYLQQQCLQNFHICVKPDVADFDGFDGHDMVNREMKNCVTVL
jgi:hypothetical protein